MFVALFAAIGLAQVTAPDERYKADILLIVAHPDDDTVVSSYLARAIFDQHKRVAVVYCTRGDSGGNSVGRERAAALGLVREIEGRKALSKLGITNVWFLDGRDTASQDVLLSLASWPSASVLEQVVRIVRLTQPQILLTWLPSSVAGENHGDHQASGVIASEAFDIAGDPTAFPSQLAAPLRQFENAFEGLTPWQPQKLYFFTDAFDTAFFKGHGPEYDGNQISPSRKVPYLQTAAQSAAAYYTQLSDPNIGKRIESGDLSQAAIADLQKTGYLPEPVRLWLGKTHVRSEVTADVFDGVSSDAIPFVPLTPVQTPAKASVEAALGGEFGFFREFWRAHELNSLQNLRPEIGLQPGDTLKVVIVLKNSSDATAAFTISAEFPPGWTLASPASTASVPAHADTTVQLKIVAPAKPSNTLSELRVRVESNGKSLLQDSVFAEVSPYVSFQIK